MNDALQMPTATTERKTSSRKFKTHADGIYFGLPEADYHADPALGASGICDLIQSPLRYWINSPYNPENAPADDEDPTDKDATAASILGDFMHDLLLEGGRKTWGEKPKGMSFATKAGKEWRDNFNADNPGGRIVTFAQAQSMRTMFNALELSGTRKLFTNGFPEVSFFWTEKGGQRCKIRIDYLKAFESLDLKTYANTMGKDTETAIAHAVANFRYSIKGFWYMHGIARMRQMIAAKGSGAISYNHPNAPTLEEEVDLISAIRDMEGEWPHKFVFVETGQVPNITVRNFESHDDGQLNAYWRYAKQGVDFATQRFELYMRRYGPDVIWIDPVVEKPFTDADFAAASWILAKE